MRGLQGALVVVLRSMMGQERGTREELGRLAVELDASLSAQTESSCHCSCNFLAEAGILGGDGLRTGPPKPCRWADIPMNSWWSLSQQMAVQKIACPRGLEYQSPANEGTSPWSLPWVHMPGIRNDCALAVHLQHIIQLSPEHDLLQVLLDTLGPGRRRQRQRGQGGCAQAAAAVASARALPARSV